MDSFDVKNIIFSELKTVLIEDITLPANLCVVGGFDVSTTTFPRVVFQELTISTDGHTLDYDEYSKMIMYQVDIFAKEPAAETMCRRIAKAVNTVLEKTIHLTQRASGNLVPVDTTSKRFTSTYVGLFDETSGKFH